MNNVNKPNRILELSYIKERDALEEDCRKCVHNIKMDNPYIVAINSAIARVNKATGLKATIDSINLYIDNLLSPEEKALINKAYQIRDKAIEKLQEKYQVAETLLDMADTYEQIKAILDKYTKDVL